MRKWVKFVLFIVSAFHPHSFEGSATKVNDRSLHIPFNHAMHPLAHSHASVSESVSHPSRESHNCLLRISMQPRHAYTPQMKCNGKFYKIKFTIHIRVFDSSGTVKKQRSSTPYRRVVSDPDNLFQSFDIYFPKCTRIISIIIPTATQINEFVKSKFSPTNFVNERL